MENAETELSNGERWSSIGKYHFINVAVKLTDPACVIMSRYNLALWKVHRSKCMADNRRTVPDTGHACCSDTAQTISRFRRGTVNRAAFVYRAWALNPSASTGQSLARNSTWHAERKHRTNHENEQANLALSARRAPYPVFHGISYREPMPLARSHAVPSLPRRKSPGTSSFRGSAWSCSDTLSRTALLYTPSLGTLNQAGELSVRGKQCVA